jgi:hypothetical protein
MIPARLPRHQPEHTLSGPEQALRSNSSYRDRLRAIQAEIARSAAILEWLAAHPGRGRLDEARAVSRKVRALRKLLEVERQEHRHLPPQEIDLGSHEVEQVVQLLIQTFEDASEAVLPGDVADELMDAARLRLEGWQEKIDSGVQK